MKKNSGFTLVELICVLVLVGVLGSGTTMGLVYFAQQQQTLRRNFQQSQKIQIAITRIMYEIKNCSSISTTNNIVSYTFGNAKTLSENNGRLILTDAGAAHILTDNISNLTAAYSDKLLSIAFTTTLSNNATTATSLSIYK